MSSAAERSTVEIVDMRNVELTGASTATSASAADMTSSNGGVPASALSSSASSSINRKHMRTHTVGNLNGHFSSALVPGALTKSLQSYFSNRLIPTYSPTKIDPTVAIVVAETKSAASTSTAPAIRATSTIFGFIDFTTVVNNTLLIFTPKVKAEISSTSKMIARIEPTRAAIFHDFVSSTATGSSLIDPLFEIGSTGQQEALPIASRSSSSTYEASESGASHHLITSSSSKEKGETEPLEMSSSFNELDSSMPLSMSSALVSGITTITSGFILPSFSSSLDDQQLQSASISSGDGSNNIAATPDVSTVAKTAVFSINEVANESPEPSSANSRQITSSSVLPVDSSDTVVQPTRPLKTFYTTYTYYTTFKDAQTQFVHSRKEVVTNVVEMQQQISASSASSQQARASIQSTSTRPTSSMDLIDSSTVSPEETAKLSSTPSLLDSSMKSHDPAGTGTSAPLNKSYLGKLLSGIAVPITHYTTFTYYTTFFKDMTSQIVSRTKVVSNVVTGTINLNQAIQKRSTEYAASPQDIVPEGAENLPIVITPVTEYATSTFFTTFFVPGQGSTVVTNIQTLSKVYLPEFSEVNRHRQTTATTIRPTATTRSSLGRLTSSRSDQITRQINGLPVLENGDLLLSSAESARTAERYSEEPEAELIKPTVTRKRIVVTRTRSLPNADSLNGLPRRSTVVVRGPPRSLSDVDTAPSFTEDPHEHQLGRLHPSVTPTPVTFYTTYTYFTTELVNGSPVVHSNEHLFSTVITGKVLPTRVQPTLQHQRVKRTVAVEPSVGGNELAEEFTDNKIDNKSAKIIKAKSTGVVSEVINKSGIHTVVTQIIGTLINGFYAQFAVTKTLEPQPMLATTADNIETNNQVDQSETGEVPSTTESTTEVETQTQTEAAAMAAETTTAMSSEATADAAATTTESNTTGNEEVTTMVNIIEESIESILNDTEKSTLADKSGSNSTEMEKSKVESSIFASHAGNVSSVSSRLDQKTASSTESETNSPAVSSPPLLPSVSFLSDTIGTIVSVSSPTPTLSASSSSSSHSVSETVKPDYRTGLISSTVESITAGNQVTRITREVFGTYIAGIYAHLAKTRSDTVGLSTSATSTTTTTQTHLTTPTPTASFSLPASSASSGSTSSSVTAIMSLVSPSTLSASFPSASTASLWPTPSLSVSASPLSTEEVRSRSENDTLEEFIAPSTSWSMLPGLSTVSLSTETINQTILVHTTEYYTTEINGFTAHYSRSTSNIAGTIEPTSSSVPSRPSVHFPTPVRFLFSTKSPEALKPVYTTSSNIIEPPRASRKYKELYGNEHDYYDEPYAQPSVGHLPRSRIIREKDSQPVVEYEYDLDYADNSEQAHSPEQPKPTPSYASEAHYQPSTYGQVNQRAQQQARTYNSMSYGATRRGSSGFGARVRSGGGNQERVALEQSIPAPVRVVEEHTAQPVQPRSRQNNGGRQAAAGAANRRRQPSRTAASPPPAPTRSLDYYNINDYSSSRYQPPMEDVRGGASSVPNRNEATGPSEYRRPINRQRQLSRQRRPYSSTTTTTTTTTPAPRNYALLPSQRLRLNRRYNNNNNNNNNNNRNRMHDTTPSNTRMQTMDHDLNRERSEVHKERVRYRGPSKPANFRQYGQQPSRQTVPPRETYQEMYPANSVYSTPTVPKVPLTVTSIVTTVKTVPIFHGFRTSYATLTTTTLSTSVIPPSLYETSVDEDGQRTQTLFTRMTDSLEPHKVTEVLVTTSALQEVKLVPIKFGYSTRTETLTDVKTFTMLTTSVHTRSQELQLPPPPGSSLLTTVTTFVSTQTLSSTTAVSLLLHGKTLVSTLTFTSLSEATVTRTETLTVALTPTAAPGAGIHPQPLVTLLTLSITGDNGEVTELVTALTVPVQQMLHTKVERDVKPTSSFSLDEHRHRPQPNPPLPPSPQHIVLESSTSAPHLLHNNYLSASFKTVDQYSETHPFFITTIFKGPNTEIYEAQATKVTSNSADNDDSPPVIFRKRKLHQFNDNLYKEPLPVLTADGNFESERSGGINSKPQAGARKPSFQRIRIKSRPNAPKSPSESRLSEFNRVMGLSDGSFAASSSANSFRRLPISREPQQQNVYSSAPSSVYTFPSSSATYLLANNFQKPTFRKVKPANNRRIVSSIRTVQPIIVSSVIQPSQVFASSLHNYNSNFMEVAKPSHSGSNSRPNVHNAAAFQSQASHLQPELQHLRSPDHHHHRQPVSGNTRNRFNSVDGLEAFEPNGHRNEFTDNYIGSLRAPSAAIGLFATQPAVEPSVHTPTIPLTYYTTFTYLTTVIRGPHTAHLSRESVTSAVTTRALDKSIVEVVRDNDGVIEPTKVLQLGVKTKGFTTTVYNAVSQVQIYNEDLYNVIQKTYNKNIQFKPWQSSSAYQPVFLTNHVEPQRESSRVWPPLSSADLDFSSPLVVNPNKVNLEMSSASHIEASPPRGNHFDFSTASLHLVTPMLSSSEEVVGHHQHGDPLGSVSRTPTIEETALLAASPVASRPVRISSSVLVRKPSNSKYAYLYTRSRLRVRVKGTNSDSAEGGSAVPNSAVTNTSPLFTSSETYEIDSTQVATEQATPSLKPGRIRTTKSKIVFRPRNSNAVLSTINPNMIRVSSRVFRPSVTLDPLTSSVILVDSPDNLPLDESSAGNSFEPEQPALDSIAHSDNARANKFTRVSNGVTLIISSKVATQNRPFTLEPTLVTGAAVMMKPIDPSAPPMPDMSSPAEPRKQYNTFTYHTTYTQGDKTYVSSSKATVEKESIEPSTTTETVQVLKTSTLYSTLTYFATLFNGSASTITPIEDVKTEYITFPESSVVTRTIEPSRPSDADLITQTHFTTYTNLATVFSDSKPVVSTLHEVVSSEVVLSKSRSNAQYSMPVSVASSSQSVKPSRTTTRSTHTTLTHFITLFSGTHTILSSIEEISPTVVTEVVGQSSTSSPSEQHRLNMPHIRFTQPSADPAKQTKNRFGGLVPSVSTLFTTHTYYTTLFSGTTSVIQSREETTHSLVTLYVHSTVAAIQPTSTAAGIEPSVRFESSTIVPASSSYVPDLVESSEHQLEPSSVFPEGASSATPSIDDESAIVFFTNFILPSSVTDTENTIDQAKGPLMNHGQLSTPGGASQIRPDQATKPLEMPPVTLVQDAAGQPSTAQGNNTIKPGAIIELSDLLDGANLAGNIGEAIKDIVQILSKGQKSKVPMAGEEIDRTSAVQEMPPKEGATVSHLDNPVYIPMYPANSETRPETTSSVEIPPVAYVPAFSSPPIAPTTTQSRSMAVMPTFIWSGELPPAPSSSIGSSSSLPKLFSRSSTFVRAPVEVTPTLLGSAGDEKTRYYTSVEATPTTVVLTTTKVYYTRDAPLTITSEYVSTLPPKTIITTVAGTKTAINTYSSEIAATSTQKQPAITAVHSVSSKPETSGRPIRPTRKPGVNRFKPPTRPTEGPKIFKTSHRPRAPYKPSPTPPPEFVPEDSGKGSFKKSTKAFMPKTTTRPSILDLDQCKPACNAANKEICKEFAGKFKCDCRPGYTKKLGSDTCHELQNFIVLVRVTKLGESDVVWQSDLLNRTSDQYMNLAKAARTQLDGAHVTEELKDNYISSDVMSIDQATDGNGVLVNMTIHLTESGNLDEDLLKEKLARTLEKSSEQLPSPSQIYADLEDVADFDECSSEEYNDCASSARCINELGTYKCECLNGYPDLDPGNPGRMCSSEIKACEFCNGRGDCFRDETGQISSCKCHRMYLGRRCDINGLLTR
ncbi:PREDICTED: mucin-12-like [Rhagoletis zephyria]|uniref:mucin-12-like n=1 Tax=Rhagoletis zephyria TaxID=28612 RepID=UPI0008116620|nr:PREDICTED: mucin-12-like [Rhagoletis zephyria]